MKAKELKLASYFLKLAENEFSNHGCNGVEESVWDGWSIEERRQLRKEMEEWNKSPEDYDPDFLFAPDWYLMAFLADKLGKLSDLPPSKEKKEIKPTIEGEKQEAEITDVIVSENTDKAGKMAQEYPNIIIWKGIEYSKVVKCDTCGCHPSVIIRTSFGSFCQQHARYV